MLKFLPLAWRLGIYLTTAVALAGGVGVGVGVFIRHERMIGWNAALARVAEQDAHAHAIAMQVAEDVATCEANGGSFDVATGNCD